MGALGKVCSYQVVVILQFVTRRDQNNTVCLKTFVLASLQFCFWFSCMADQKSPEIEPRYPALAVSEFNRLVLTFEDFE